MKKKRLFSLFGCAAVLVMLAACSRSEPAASSTSSTSIETASSSGGEEHYKFAYTCMDQSNPFFVYIERTIRDEVEARGDTLVSVDPANDVTRQLQEVEDVIAQNIDGIFLNPVEAEGIMPAVDWLTAANIPIVNFDTEIADMSKVTTYTGSDNYNGGYVCGQDLVARRPNGGDVIVLDSPTMNSVVDRTNGFLDAIKDHGFNIVAQQDAKGNLQTSMSICEDLLQGHLDVTAIFGGNDPTALGALAAANAAGIQECLIYGVDGSPDIKAELAKGDSLIAGTGAQSPIGIAKMCVELMYKIMNGESVEARYPIETFLINADNVAQYGTDGWQ